MTPFETFILGMLCLGMVATRARTTPKPGTTWGVIGVLVDWAFMFSVGIYLCWSAGMAASNG